MNGILASVFILVGSFTGLITLIGYIPFHLLLDSDMYVATNIVLLEMIKFFCYMMSILGIFIIRRRVDKQMPNASHPTCRSYRTWVGNPIIFASVSGVLIIRGATSAPLHAPVILSIGILGLAMLYRRFSSRSHRVSPPI